MFAERLQRDLRARGQSRDEIRQDNAELTWRRGRGEQHGCVLGATAVVEIEQRMFGFAVAGNRVDIVEREQLAATEPADCLRAGRPQRGH